MKRSQLFFKKHFVSYWSQKRCLSDFRVVEHVVPCSHTRTYPGATEFGCENSLKLAVKQYIPLQGPESCLENDQVTVIAAHANGFPKELYEPLWADLLEQLRSAGKTVRSIWITDIAQQGRSGLINEAVLGSDPNWWDHARDLMHLINLKQKHMPQPLVGIGHSMGASHLAALSLLHPGLFQTLVLIEPVVQEQNPSKTFAPQSTYRREHWTSREDARDRFAKSRVYQSWDSRVLAAWLENGLKDANEAYQLPTDAVNPREQVPITPSREAALHDPSPGTDSSTAATETLHIETRTCHSVKLTTPVPQEISQYLRPLYHLSGSSSSPVDSELESYVYPDLNHSDLEAWTEDHRSTFESSSSSSSSTPPPSNPNSQYYDFYRPEPVEIFRRLPELRPSTLYVFGGESPLATPELRRAKLDQIGTGVGGSGGAKAGRVKEVVVEEKGHLVPFEDPGRCAVGAAGWIAAELDRWARARAAWKEIWHAKAVDVRRGRRVDEEWMKRIPRPVR